MADWTSLVPPLSGEFHGATIYLKAARGLGCHAHGLMAPHLVWSASVRCCIRWCHKAYSSIDACHCNVAGFAARHEAEVERFRNNGISCSIMDGRRVILFIRCSLTGGGNGGTRRLLCFGSSEDDIEVVAWCHEGRTRSSSPNVLISHRLFDKYSAAALLDGRIGGDGGDGCSSPPKSLSLRECIEVMVDNGWHEEVIDSSSKGRRARPP